MVPSDARYLEPTVPQRTWHDHVIENGINALLVLSPLFFGSVHIWSSALLQLGSFSLFITWLHKKSQEPVVFVRGWRLAVAPLMIAVLALVQVVPVPPFLVKILSPAAGAIYASTGQYEPGAWHPLSIHPKATLQELLNILAYVCVFMVVVNQWGTRRQILRTGRVIIFMGCALVVIAVLQKAFWTGRLLWFYPLDQALQARISYIWGPYVNRNHFAGYLEIAIPLALGHLVYTALYGQGTESGSLTSRALSLAISRNLIRFVFLLLSVAIMSGALISTLSRGGIMGFLASLTVFALLMRSRRLLRQRSILFLILGILVAMIALFSVRDRLEERLMKLADEDRILRAQVWSDLIPMVRDFPVVGTGMGTFDRGFTRYQTKYSVITFEHAENDYLEFLTEGGVIGLTLWLVTGTFCLVSIYTGWKRRQNSFSASFGAAAIASCAAIAVHSFTDFNLRVPANALLLVVIVAMGLASVKNSRRTQAGGAVLKLMYA